MGVITQDDMKRLYPELGGNKHQPTAAPVTPGDGSRYGKRHAKGQMNKTETEYALILESRKQAGEIASWEFETEVLELADRCTYLADFRIAHNDGSLEYVDVKVRATVNQTTINKLKWCKDKFKKHRFTMETKMPKREGGGWKRREF